ncbi:MAG: hypothetical protein R2712_16550 [Vicinamibacterales bacterium]
MVRSATVLAIGLSALLATAMPAAAQRWGRPSLPSSGACFYEDINFSGRYFCARTGNNMPRVPSGTDDGSRRSACSATPRSRCSATATTAATRGCSRRTSTTSGARV